MISTELFSFNRIKKSPVEGCLDCLCDKREQRCSPPKVKVGLAQLSMKGSSHNNIYNSIIYHFVP